jgi:hypothetical protein
MVSFDIKTIKARKKLIIFGTIKQLRQRKLMSSHYGVMEAVSSSEMPLIFYQTIRRNIS